MSKTIYKKKKLLLLGSGELGKELVIEAKRLGCEVIAVDKYSDAPAMQLSDHSYVLDMGDKDSLIKLINELKPDFVIPEIESLSIDALKDLEISGVKVVPNARTVEITMNRDKIRNLANDLLKIKTAKYNYVFNCDHLIKSANEIGFPLLMKPLMSSSGKGQSTVTSIENLSDAWENAIRNSRGNIKGVILEEFIRFDYEFTLLSIRTTQGNNIYCLPIGHQQSSGDYQCSWQPLAIDEGIFLEAKNITDKILNNLDGAGIYGVEFFVRENELIFSELSPRPHDTGLVTLLSQNINEFELHLRAFLDLPIPSVNLIRPAATRVILSDFESNNFEFEGVKEALKVEESKLLIFGKPLAKNGRRMGVVISTGETIQIARSRADESASRIKLKSN